MKIFVSFVKKEWMEHIRSGRLLILGIVFILFGIMNPAIAKLTPWLLETMTESLAQSGISTQAVTVTALDSWVQFFKNMPMALIIFLLLESSVFTREYQSGSLIPVLTKGTARYQIILSKGFLLLFLWSLFFWIHFSITYAYTAYYWDMDIVENLFFAILSWWLFGILTIGLLVMFSTIFRTNTGVLLGIGSIVLLCLLISIAKDLQPYLYTQLTDGNSLIYGVKEPADYYHAWLIAAISTILCFAISIPCFNKIDL